MGMREAGVTVRLLPLALAAVLAVFPGVAWPDDTIIFTTLVFGDQSGIRTRMEVVVRTPTEWQTLWKEHMAGLPRTVASPVVDFSREMIIGIFAGEVLSPAHVSVEKIVRQEGQLVVRYQVGDLQPGPPELDTRMITPFQILRLARSTLPVVFIPAKKPAY